MLSKRPASLRALSPSVKAGQQEHPPHEGVVGTEVFTRGSAERARGKLRALGTRRTLPVPCGSRPMWGPERLRLGCLHLSARVAPKLQEKDSAPAKQALTSQPQYKDSVGALAYAPGSRTDGRVDHGHGGSLPPAAETQASGCNWPRPASLPESLPAH